MATKVDSAASKADPSVFAPGERFALVREILGILLTLASLLMLMALISAHRQAHWIGFVGDWVAGNLTFVLGRTMAFVLPVMTGICAIQALRGASPVPTHGRGWLRGLGGLLILISSCPLLNLSVVVQGPLSANRAFARGGLIGIMLVDASGLRLGLLLGRMGATILFSGLALIGVVLFTETLLRDLGGLFWRAVRQLAKLRVYLRLLHWPRWLHWPQWLHIPGLALLRRCWGWLGAVGRWLISPLEFLNDLQFIDQAADWMYGLFKSDIHLHGRVFGGGRPATQQAPTAEVDAPEESAYEDHAEEGEEAEEHEIETYEDDADLARPALERRARSGFARPRPLAPAKSGPIEIAMGNPAAAALRRKSAGRAWATVQAEMNLFPADFQLPPLSLLSDPPAMMYEMSDEDKERLSRKIEQTLAQFKIEVEVFEVVQGPVITRFALKVAPGVRVNRIISLESELAMALKAQHVRILAPIPGQSAVGIEVPNKKANPVLLKDLLSSDTFQKHKSPLSFALGKNIAGETIVCDLATMPHLLIAGATGSGKSVCLNAIIASFLYRNKPDRVKFVMIDPKRVELSIYQAIPHLIAPVVSETKKAAAALAWCVEQMEARYKLLAEIGVRNLDIYNALLIEKTPNKKIMGRGDLKFLPHIVIIIDELADLMMVAKNEVEEYIIRLAQMARAVGMHLVLATQRPSVNVITGIIKANFPSRIAFQVSSKVDSRTILDLNGAEALMGRGDMLYSPGGAKPFRIQGAFVADGEVERLADYIREQEKARYEKEDFEARPTPAERAKAQLRVEGEDDDEADEGESGSITLGGLAAEGRAGAAPLTPADMEMLGDEDLYDMALRLILESRKASVSYIQRRMKIGYARAGRIMDLMEERGIVGPYAGSKPRTLLVNPEEFLAAGRAEE